MLLTVISGIFGIISASRPSEKVLWTHLFSAAFSLFLLGGLTVIAVVGLVRASADYSLPGMIWYLNSGFVLLIRKKKYKIFSVPNPDYTDTRYNREIPSLILKTLRRFFSPDASRRFVIVFDNYISILHFVHASAYPND